MEKEKGDEMTQILILTGLSILSSILGVCFIEGTVCCLMKIFGVCVWVFTTMSWWWYPLCDKWFK